VLSKEWRERFDEQPPVRGRNLWDLIADILASDQRTENLLRLLDAAADLLVRVMYPSALVVAAGGAVLVLLTNGRSQLFGRVLLAAAGVAIVATTSRAVRRWRRQRRSSRETGSPDPPRRHPPGQER
jgi:hypothetical protein